MSREGLADLNRKHYADKCVTHVKDQIMEPRIISYLEEDINYCNSCSVVSECSGHIQLSVAKQLA